MKKTKKKFDIENFDVRVYKLMKKHPFMSSLALVLLSLSIVLPFIYEFATGNVLLTQAAVYKEATPLLFVIHLFTDIAIGLSYFVITFFLIIFSYKAGRDLPFMWVFVAFGVFIVACGITHVMEAFVLWKPIYWVAGGVKWLTAIVSIGTALTVPFLLPRGLELVAKSKTNKEREVKYKEQNKLLEENNKILEEVNAEFQIRTKNLEQKKIELQDLNNKMVGRELKIIELKEEIEALQKKINKYEK